MTTIIRINHEAIPDNFDIRLPNAVAGMIETSLHEDGVKADVSHMFSHFKIELPTRQLAAACAALVEMGLI